MKFQPKVLVLGSTNSALNKARVKELSRIGCTVYWLSSKSHDGSDGVNYLGFGAVFGEYIWNWFISPLVLLYCVAKVRPQVIHVFYAYQRLLVLPLLLFRIPVVTTVMGGDILSDQSYRGYKRWFTKLMLLRSTIITTKSKFLQNRVVFISSRCKVASLSWGVDLKLFYPHSQREEFLRNYGVDPLATVFCSHRGCYPIYQNEIILKGFSRVSSQIDGAVLIINRAGFDSDPEYFHYLESLVLELGILDKVVFIDPMELTQMPLLYSSVDAVVTAAASDGMPQSLYESMACGCINIIGDLPQYKEVLTDRKNCLFYQSSDSDSLGQQMAWFLKNKDVVLKIKDEAELNAKNHFDIDKERQKLKMIYATVLGAKF